MMGFVRRIENKLTLTFEWVATTLAAALVVVVFLGILDRFLFLIGWSWPEELARFILTWLAFVAFSLCVQKSMHYRVEFLIGKITHEKSAIYLELLVLLICIVVVCILGVKGFYFALDSRGQTSAALKISMSIIYSVIPISAALMLFFMAIRIVDKIKDLSRGGNRQ